MSKKKPKGQKFIPPSVAELVPLFPAYEIEDFIAAGGMGAVYKATQKSLDRPVAIKILPKEFGEDEVFRNNFEEEAKAMAKLNHPNLIAVYDFGNAEGMLYIVMEFVRGKALYYSAYRKKIDHKTALNLILEVAKGLAHAHDNGILHRDIKPANILLLPSTSPKIGDFGLARAVNAQSRTARPTYGTPGYTALEVYSKKYPVDERADIFSLGAMLCELVSGVQPKPNSSCMISGIDPRLDKITRKATHPVPEQRHQSMEEFIREIKELLSNISKKGPKFATRLPPTDLSTSHTGLITSPITVPNLTQRTTKGFTTTPRSSTPTALITITCLSAVIAVIYFVLDYQKQKTVIETVVEKEEPQEELVEKTKTTPTPPKKVETVITSKISKAQLVEEHLSPDHEAFSLKLKEIRTQLHKTYARPHLRYQRSITHQSKKFLDFGITNLNTNRYELTPKNKEHLIKISQEHLDQGTFPDSLPEFAPASLQSSFKNTQQQLQESQKNYDDNFKRARYDYIEALNQAAREAQKNQRSALFDLLVKEKDLVTSKENYLKRILSGISVSEVK